MENGDAVRKIVSSMGDPAVLINIGAEWLEDMAVATDATAIS